MQGTKINNHINRQDCGKCFGENKPSYNFEELLVSYFLKIFILYWILTNKRVIVLGEQQRDSAMFL